MRVLLVDDHNLFRAGLSTMLSAWGLDIVGQAGDGLEAIDRTRELKPDVVFMDINMPNLSGLEATRVIKAESPDTRVIILTVSDDERDLFEAIKSGAEGYLLKNLTEDELEELVTRLNQGEPVMSPGLAGKLLQEFVRLREDTQPSDDEPGLTQREHEVLEQVARGDTNKEIAAALFISENTVNFHMKNMLSKMHVKNRAQVVAWAVEHGYTSR